MLYMLDTNIISYFAEGELDVISNLEKCVFRGNEIGISVVANYEVERGLKYVNSSRKLDEFYQFVSQCRILPVTLYRPYHRGFGHFYRGERTGK